MTTILEALQSRGLVFKKVAGANGGEWAGPCPACGGRDRFRCWPEQRGGGCFWCRQCGAKGDSIEFYRKFEGLGFKDAAIKAGMEGVVKDSRARRRARVTALPAARPGRHGGQGGAAAASGSGGGSVPEWTPRAVDPPPTLWMEKAGAFLGWCQERLTRAPTVLAWLQEARGLRPETVRAAGLGWNPGDRGRDLYRPRSAWGLPAEMNDRGQERKLWLPLGLVLPYVRDGVVVRLKIRRPKAGDALPPELAPPHEHGPKWARGVPFAAVPGSCECSFFLAGHGADDRPLPVVVLESELDALLLHQVAGDLAHVLGLGSASNRPDAGVADVLHAAPALLLCLDYDDAGASAASWWLERYARAEVWPVPSGKDPNEARLAGHDLRAWLEAGLPARPCLPGRSGGAADVHDVEHDRVHDGGHDVPEAIPASSERGPAECWL